MNMKLNKQVIPTEVFFFKQSIVITQKNGNNFELIQEIPFSRWFLRKKRNQSNKLLELRSYHPQKRIIFTFKSIEEKETWFILFSSIFLDYQLISSPPFPIFQPDPVEHCCFICGIKFTVFRRRHHCRKCGLVACNYCTSHREIIPWIDPNKTYRVCLICKSHSNEIRN
eukprot:Anaeramoba_ignava/c18686_g2_i1.p1 GENE.c18686_g2_i1~~c18686_g2_i1.p1  ORF type:complete len:169 (-),score=42.66 c18686_g2_i1:161-667(-)